MKTRISDPAALHVPAKWYRHYQKLQSLREALMAERADQVSEITEPLEQHSMDDADSATDEFDHNLALGMLSYEDDTLFEVDAAIQRILDGTYGICEVTGKAIPEERLRVVPWTRYTKEALERIERQQPSTGPHFPAVSSIQGPAPGGLPEAPEPEDLMSTETALRDRREKIRDFSGDAGLTITPNPPFEP
jgi:RNA polymerase-binding transcription factor DksA